MDARGQSETIGLVLLLAITVLGVGVVVAVGSGALEGAQEATAVQRAEQSMSLLDARVAVVALGRTDSQSVSLAGAGDGAYEIHPDAGRIVVARVNNNTTQNVYANVTLGAVVYENGGTTVVYQGGGVWRSSGRGATVIAPPEFNYQAATLTLPIIQVNGNRTSVGGAPTVRITPDTVDVSKFPTASNKNPLSNGTVVVTVHSDYYRGWATFFRERTDGNVTVYPEQEKVELALVARGQGGQFSLEEMPLHLRGLADDDPIEDLQFTLEPKKDSKFNDLDWSLVADDGGSQRFEFNVDGGNPCQTGNPTVTITYTNGSTTHTWQNDSAFVDEGGAFTYDCGGDDGDTPTFYLNLTGNTSLPWDGSGSAPLADDSVGNLVDHYLAKMGPNVDLEVYTKGKQTAPGNSASLSLEASSGVIEYAPSDERVVTFLHVSKNVVNVTFT